MEIKKRRTKEKTYETKCSFFGKINKIDELLARMIMKKREEAQNNKIMSDREDITNDVTEIKGL